MERIESINTEWYDALDSTFITMDQKIDLPNTQEFDNNCSKEYFIENDNHQIAIPSHDSSDSCRSAFFQKDSHIILQQNSHSTLNNNSDSMKPLFTNILNLVGESDEKVPMYRVWLDL